MRNVYYISVEKCENKRTIWRLNYRWEANNLNFELKVFGLDCSSSGYSPVAGCLENAENLYVHIELKILDQLNDYDFLKKLRDHSWHKRHAFRVCRF
jgi:hypothetical protein